MTQIELVYIPSNQIIARACVNLTEGMRVSDALEASGLLRQHPELAEMPVGIFSRSVSLDTFVRAGDRIEFYRPLLLDPMEKRRQRAGVQK